MNFTGNPIKLASNVVKSGGCLVSLLCVPLCVIGAGAGIQGILSSTQTTKTNAVNENHLTDKRKQ